MVTSSGMSRSSMISRTKSKSVWEAAGNPTSISLKPILTSVSNMRRLRAASMGSINAWLPSRKSTLHQVGGAVMTVLGQVLSPKPMGANARYLVEGLRNMLFSCSVGPCPQHQLPTPKEALHLRNSVRSFERDRARGDGRLAAQQRRQHAHAARARPPRPCGAVQKYERP